MKRGVVGPTFEARYRNEMSLFSVQSRTDVGGLSLLDGLRTGLESARVSAAAAKSRQALDAETGRLMQNPRAMARFMRSDPDPVLLTLMAGPRAMANLAGVDVGGKEPPTFLEKVAREAASRHLVLARMDPKAAALSERRWQAGREILARGFAGHAVSRVSESYGRAVSSAVRPAARAVVSTEPWRGVGVMSGLPGLLGVPRRSSPVVVRERLVLGDDGRFDRSTAEALRAVPAQRMRDAVGKLRAAVADRAGRAGQAVEGAAGAARDRTAAAAGGAVGAARSRLSAVRDALAGGFRGVAVQADFGRERVSGFRT